MEYPNHRITASINRDAINRDWLYQGKKGAVLDIVLIARPDDKYGNHYMVVQAVPKQHRAPGVKGPILGNAKIWETESRDASDTGRARTDSDTKGRPGAHSQPYQPARPAPTDAQLANQQPGGGVEEDVPFMSIREFAQ